MIIEGPAFILGDHVSADAIHPSRYLYDAYDAEGLARHAFEGIIDDFASRARGVVIVAGVNFGCGSSREQAVMALKYAGVKAIIAKSFARTFYRNAIAHAVPVLECPGAASVVKQGDKVSIDLETGRISYPCGDLSAHGFPEEVRAIIEAGGLLPYAKRLLADQTR